MEHCRPTWEKALHPAARVVALVQPSTCPGLPSTSLPCPPRCRMVLVDALPLLYKAHFAFPPDARLRSAAGADTTVVYVFLNMLLNLLSLAPPPTHFAVVFDASGKTFRYGCLGVSSDGWSRRWGGAREGGWACVACRGGRHVLLDGWPELKAGPTELTAVALNPTARMLRGGCVPACKQSPAVRSPAPAAAACLPPQPFLSPGTQ